MSIIPKGLRGKKRKSHIGIKLEALDSPINPKLLPERAQALLSSIGNLAYNQLPPELLQGYDIDLSMWTLITFDSCLEKLTRNQFSVATISNQALESPKHLTKTPSMSPSKQIKGMSINLKNGEHITDRGIRSIISSVGTSLQSLVLKSCPKITDLVIHAIATNCRYIRRLDLSHLPQLDGSGIAALGDCCGYLEELSVNGCRQLPEYVLLKVTSGCYRLRVLDVAQCCHMTDQLLTSISQSCRHIQHINVSECREISDVGWQKLALSCLDLTQVNLTRSEFQYKLTDMCLLSYSEHSKILQHISLSGCDYLTDAGISWLASGCAALTHVDISYCVKLTDYSLRSLGEGCLHLSFLDISSCARMSDVGLKYLSVGCSELSTLRMKGIIFASAGAIDNTQDSHTLQGFAALGLRCTKLQHLDATKCIRIDDMALKKIAHGFHDLVYLSFVQCSKITSSGICSIAAHCTKLKSLLLTDCIHIDDNALSSIGKHLHSLETLKLRGCERISTKGIQKISQGCHLLSVLDLTGCTLIDDMGLLAICEGLTNLQNLWLSGLQQLTIVGISWLAERCPNIMLLDVTHSSISHVALKPLRTAWKYGVLRDISKCHGIFPLHRAQDMLFIDKYGHCWKAAIKIQCMYRVKVARRIAAAQREQALMRWAANRMQSIFRGRQARRYVWVRRLQLRKQTQAATLIQCTYRAKKARELAERLRKEAEAAHRVRMAIRIQTAWRCKKARGLLIAKREALAQLIKTRNAAARVLQRSLRKFVWRKRSRLHHEACLARHRERDAAARKLQTIYRGRAARLKALELRCKQEIMLLKRHCAATLLQLAFRRRRERRIFALRVAQRVAETAAATRVQRQFRARRNMLAYQVLQYNRQMQALIVAARKVQSAWRCKQGRLGLHMLKFLKDKEYDERVAAAIKLQTIFRGRKARQFAAKAQQDAILRLIMEAKMKNHLATVIQAGWRGKKGRDRHKQAIFARKKLWKEVPNVENGTKHQDTGEIRHRMPQDMLDLLPHPHCDDCDVKEAATECKDCQEFFCKECFEAIHAGGKRRRHGFRSLYDYYNKRIDYGEGEFPSLWPSEIEQDELDGWYLRSSTVRDPDVVIDVWEKYIDHNTHREWYFNNKTKVSTYVPPEEFKASAQAISLAWVRKYDITNRVDYYFNQITGHRTFDRPATFIEKTLDKSTTYTEIALDQPATYTEIAQPEILATEIWSKHWDEAYQVYYYFNAAANESTYERPETFNE
ncbi:hypothetical protein THRCLA_08666 [Thraustotheca clavata]|uniref:WW domain-containing protein n=1 Tax=Thraustotheca clavata TaxID=74557 RepID=A0A1V9Z3M1_9STRA|nr:hypothetical protein THRCLA_08666 [Thraustotheca clavata]